MARQPSRYRAKRLEPRWEPYIEAGGALASLDRALREDGFVRAGKVRASLRRGRIMTFRFAWSKASGALELRFTHIEQFDIGLPKEVTP